MAFATLIDTEYVFIHSTIDKNTDADLIAPNIIVAQDTNIQQILGYTLYQKLMDLVSTGDINDSSNSKYLLLLANFVQPALCHHTVWHSLPSIQYRLTNKSILSKTSDSATTTGLKELMYMRDNVKHYADFYNQRIRELIINNPSDYPEYFQSVGIDRIRPKRTTYFSGWSGNAQGTAKKPNNGYGDPDCCDEPWGTPLNW
jgi:hypothetical protein